MHMSEKQLQRSTHHKGTWPAHRRWTHPWAAAHGLCRIVMFKESEIKQAYNAKYNGKKLPKRMHRAMRMFVARTGGGPSGGKPGGGPF